MTRPSADELIRELSLQPLPGEGGWFRRTSPDHELGARPPWTCIYYLLRKEPDGFSEMHRLDAPEVYHFYLGDPVELLLLHPNGRHELVVLGSDVMAGQVPQCIVPAGVWQGSRLLDDGEYALMGTNMTPGFDVSHYERGMRVALMGTYPQQADRIRALTRE